MDDGKRSVCGECLSSPLLSGDRGGLHSASWLRAGPARLTDQEVTTFIIQTRTHRTPLTTTDDTNVHTGRSGSRRPGDLSLLAGAASRLSGDGSPRLAAVSVQSDDLTGSRRQLTFFQDLVVEDQQQEEAERRGCQSPDQPEELHEGDPGAAPGAAPGANKSELCSLSAGCCCRLTTPRPPRSDPQEDGSGRRMASPGYEVTNPECRRF